MTTGKNILNKMSWCSFFSGTDIFSGGVQALWLVPNASAIWVLFVFWTGRAAAYSGQKETVRLLFSVSEVFPTLC